MRCECTFLPLWVFTHRPGSSEDKKCTICGSPQQKPDAPHFFLPPDLSLGSVCSHEITFPNITTPLPSMKATRERPSQFLKVSATSGCWGWKLHSAISFDFSE